MHKIHSKPFELEDFSMDHMTEEALVLMKDFVAGMEKIRLQYIDTKGKEDWYSLIQVLPSSYNQMRTCTMSYENLIAMYHARCHHKLAEWHDFCDWTKTLPYFEELFLQEKDDKSE